LLIKTTAASCALAPEMTDNVHFTDDWFSVMITALVSSTKLCNVEPG